MITPSEAYFQPCPIYKVEENTVKGLAKAYIQNIESLSSCNLDKKKALEEIEFNKTLFKEEKDARQHK